MVAVRVPSSKSIQKQDAAACDKKKCDVCEGKNKEVYVYEGSEIKTVDVMWCGVVYVRYVQNQFRPRANPQNARLLTSSGALKHRLRTRQSQAGGRCAPRADACPGRLGFYN